MSLEYRLEGRAAHFAVGCGGSEVEFASQRRGFTMGHTTVGKKGATDVEEGPPADREDLEEHRAQGRTAEIVLYSKIHKLRIHESVLLFIEEETSAGRNACEAKLGRVSGKDRLHDDMVVEVVARAGSKHRPRSAG